MPDFLDQAESLLHAGDPHGALKALTEAVRAKPGDAKLRIFMAQLLCVLGQWQRAHTQINVCADLDKLAIPMRETVGHALRCELMREQVFAGKRSPMVVGQPDPWLAQLTESLRVAGEGQHDAAAKLAGAAFEAAPTRPGSIDGQPFEWIADADSRLGPVLEACINGNYYWLPFDHILCIDLDPPEDLRDSVWMPAHLKLANGADTVALIPTCYPGSHGHADGLISLARKTEWTAAPGDRYFGLGQRVLTTDQGDHDLMAVRKIEFAAAS